jgi:hypothetical protein
MKKITTLFTGALAALALISSSLNAQITYTDDFSTAKDYTASGSTTGTIWDGVKVNNGYLVVSDTAKAVALNTTDAAGSLTFTTANSYFASDNDNGVFLYKKLHEAGADFDCKVKIVGGDFLSLGNTAVAYLMVGPMVRLVSTDTFGFACVQVFDRPAWGAVFGLRDVPASTEENWMYAISADTIVKQGLSAEGQDTVSITKYPWVRLTKVDTTITGYFSADGTTWIQYLQFGRPDFNDFDLEVGLYNATYTTDSGTVVFDDFSLTDQSAVASGVTSIEKASKLNVYATSNLSIVVKDAEDIKYVNIINAKGQVISAKSNSGNNRLVINVQQAGFYIVKAQYADGSSKAQKLIVQ